MLSTEQWEIPVFPASGPPDGGPRGSLLLSGHGGGRPARQPWAHMAALTPWEAVGTGVLLRTQYLKHEMRVHSFGILSSISDQWHRQLRTERRREQKPMVPARGHCEESSGSRDTWLGATQAGRERTALARCRQKAARRSPDRPNCCLIASGQEL